MTDIAYSISALIEAVKDRDEARGNCDSSWGYWGSDFEERVTRATKALEDDIREIIRDELAKQSGDAS